MEKLVLFFGAWGDEIQKSKLKPQKLGQITLNIRDKQRLAYNNLRTKHIAKRRAITHGKYR